MTDLIESEDELLDPQPAPGRAGEGKLAAAARRLRARGLVRGLSGAGGLGGLGGLTSRSDGEEDDPRRRRRAVQAGALTVVLVAGAGAAGVAVHRTDLHRSQSQVQDRMLLHLLGGGASMTYSGSGARSGMALPDSFDAPLPTDFTIGVRNDGARAMEVVGVRIQQPGVDVVDAAPKATVKPGESVALTTRVAVHCTAPDLPGSPTGATVTVRSAAAPGRAAGTPTDVPLAFTGGADGGTAPNSEELQTSMVGSYVTGSFYRLCGTVLAKMPVGITVGFPAADAGPGNPVVRYTLHISGARNALQVVAPSTTAPTMPGVTSETDLKGPQPIGPAGVDVAVTDRITDCRALGDYLAIRGGASTAALLLSAVAPVAVEAADPRFRVPSPPASPMRDYDALTGESTSDVTFQDGLLGQMAAACPDL